MSILDSILAGTGSYSYDRTNGSGTLGGGARVISSNNNVNTINWVAGMSDPGEMIGCGMYQELRRLDGEADRDYQARIGVILMTLPTDVREKIMAAGVKAATARAGYDLSNGRVGALFARKGAWSDLGTVFDRELTGAEVLANGFAWKVVKVPYTYTTGPKAGQTAPDAFYLVRDDTGAVLAPYAGSKYEPAQNWHATELLDRVIGQFGARYEAALSLHGGTRVVFQVHFPKQSFTLGGKDENRAYVTWVNDHVPGTKAIAFATTTRTECDNTARRAVREDGAKGIGIRHTGDVRAKVREVQNALGIAVESLDKFKGEAEQLYRSPLNVNHYAKDVLDAVLDVTEAQASLGAVRLADDDIRGRMALDAALKVTETERDLLEKSFARKIKRRGEVLEEVLSNYETGDLQTAPMGSAWRAVQAVTQSANHGLLNGRFKGDATDRKSRAFESVIAGDADDIQQTAYQIAMGRYGN